MTGPYDDETSSPATTRRAIQDQRRKGRHGRKARRAQARQARRRRWPRRLLYASLALVVLAAALAAGAWYYGRYRYDQIKKITAKHLVAPSSTTPGQPFNVLLVGSDSRKFATTTTNIAQYGTATITGGQRSDVTMVARIVPATKSIYVISIPRDLWVTIPGGVTGVKGHNRINAAFNTGPDLLVQTIETDLGIPINHYMAVTFSGFQTMVTAVGGVDMDFPDPVKDAYSGLDVTQTGCQVVIGKTALALVRSRHLYYEATGTWTYDGLSDFSRIQRQDAFFRALLNKVRTIKLNPIAINNFLGAAVKSLTIDTTFSESDLINLIEQFHDMTSNNLHTETLPTVGHTTTTGADVLERVEPDDDKMIAAFNAIGTATGTTSTSKGKSTSTTTSTTLVAPSAVTVRVLNGVTFTKPLASETATDLRKDDFVVSGITNAPATIATTQIQYGPSGESAAQTLQDDVGGTSQLVLDPSLSGNDLVVTLGASFTSVRLTTPATASSTGATTSTPTATQNGSSVPVSQGDVYTNTQTEPWNPTPCSDPG